ncbi:uncharacterized protein LOC131149317 isoform X2 [Malania oleifera]|uniref:uncharacterized protein LOC131149317 isoform X2 n=1 Tax=Malania oleifera TaxID=397392 RepID=UPI0025AE06FB|nr:uncharacterized protein LOC131149317 isoform X2 [Malania oleifera]
MTRCVLRVNSLNSHRFISTLRCFDLAASKRRNILFSCPNYPRPDANIQISTTQDRKFTSPPAITGRRKADPLSMDSDISRSAESSSLATVGEEFVHIDNSDVTPSPSPIPNQDCSYNGISGVDELRNDYGSACGGEEDSGGVEIGGEEEKIMPSELMRSVVTLSCESTVEGGSCDVYLVGTAHVSQESCREVKSVISFLKPQVVFLELCSSRVAILTPQNLKVPTMGEMLDMLKKKHNIFGVLYSWFLAKACLIKLEVFPGSEFRVAFEEAMKYGSKVILGDRPVQITLRRTWGKMPLWNKAKLLYSLLFQAVFLPSPEDLNKMLKEMDDVDMLTLVIQEMSKEFPTLMETLVHERDQYMSSTLLRVASEHSSVVAVVGKGHLQGIKKHWKQPVEVKDLMTIPSQKSNVSAVKIFASLGVAVAGLAIVSGIYLASKK